MTIIVKVPTNAEIDKLDVKGLSELHQELDDAIAGKNKRELEMVDPAPAKACKLCVRGRLEALAADGDAAARAYAAKRGWQIAVKKAA